MEILSRLFGNEAKAKIMRLFIFNPGAHFTLSDIKARTLLVPAKIRPVVEHLCSMGFLHKRAKLVLHEVKKTSKKRQTVKKDKEIGYTLDQRFPYLKNLDDLMAAASLHTDERLAHRFDGVGRVRLLIASGIFTRQPDGRLDLLLVGDDINDKKLARAISTLETDIGRELVYSCLTVQDFHYRLGMHDRLIRDVIDFPHMILIDKIGFKSGK